MSEHKNHEKLSYVAFRPLEDRVLVRRLDAEKVSAGGIVIPDSAQEKSCDGVVVATGPGKRVDGLLREPAVKRGDVVVLSKYGGTDVVVNGEKMVIVREDDLLGVREP